MALSLGLAEGVLPLHFASRLDQRQIGALYVGVAVLVAASAASAGSLQPRRALAASAVLLVGGITLAGAAGSVPGFVAGLVLAGVGIGAGQTSATGILLATVAPERIVTAMVVWSQLGIVGYLAGPGAWRRGRPGVRLPHARRRPAGRHSRRRHGVPRRPSNLRKSSGPGCIVSPVATALG